MLDIVVKGDSEADGGISLDELTRSEESKDGSTAKSNARKKIMRQSKKNLL